MSENISDYIKILGLDPGITTGYAMLEIPKKLIGKLNPEQDYSELLLTSGVWDINEKKYTLLEYLNPDFVVIEDFRLYPWTSKAKIWDDFKEVKVLGGYMTLLQEVFDIPYILQLPAKKNFYTDEILKQMNLYPKVIHTRDAVRHVLQLQHSQSKLLLSL